LEQFESAVRPQPNPSASICGSARRPDNAPRDVREILHFFIDALAVYGGLAALVKRRAFLIGWLAVAAGLLAIFAQHAWHTIAQSLATPPLWDFVCFWLYGRVADVTHLPYDPHAMHRIALALPPYGTGFAREVLDVGFIYPPPTIALFAPLGLFQTPHTAMPFWYAVLLPALCLEIVLLWRRFLYGYGWQGLVSAALLVLLFPTTVTVLGIGQTLFIASVFLLLYLNDASSLRRGVWLGFAAIVKPYMIVIWLYPVLRRDWRVLSAAMMTVAGVTAAVLPLIGWRSIVSFLTDPPSRRLPDWMLTDDSNQSLLAWLVRSTHRQAHVTAAVHMPIYLFAVIALVAITAWCIVRIGEADRDYCIVILVPLALLIYPATGWHYAPLLLVPLCYLWSRKNAIPYGAICASAATIAVFMLAETGSAAMFASLLMWILLVGVATYIRTQYEGRAATPESVGWQQTLEQPN